MPAIQPAKLRHQAILLAEHFANPAAFVRSLHHLLDFYADRARRPGQSGQPSPLIMAYKVRPPVLRQILLELVPLANDDPQGGLALCDALWEQPYLEFRSLATMVLGTIPCDSSEVVGRLQSWIKPELEDYLINALLSTGLAHLRQVEPEAIIALIRDWFAAGDTFHQLVGLRAMLPMIGEPTFENLPIFFRMIQPFTRNVPPALRPDLLDVLEALAQRSPQETAYFLRQTLELPSATDTAWLIRQNLHAFPPEIQQSLRQAVRGIG